MRLSHFTYLNISSFQGGVNKRSYSTAQRNYELIKNNKTNKLNPGFITGFSDASTKYLVVFGSNLQSTVGSRFTRTQLAMIILAPYQKETKLFFSCLFRERTKKYNSIY
jgi:hypothetical protein